MNIYSKKQQWKLLLLGAAIIIAISSMWYTNSLVERISNEERKKVKLWANAYVELAKDMNDYTFVTEVIRENETIPVILTDSEGNIDAHKNLDSLRAANDPTYLHKQLEDMKVNGESIELSVEGSDTRQFIYYKSSTILTMLKYYPFFQLGVISLFIVVSYFAFSASRKAEQNQVWVGMAKETAHQLGTPLSSLMAWLELLKEKKSVEDSTVGELEKDVNRLETITERFSKIGSVPSLVRVNICSVLGNSINYIQTRVSKKVTFSLKCEGHEDMQVPINVSLFEWVVENLCKNAVDAMEGNGEITIAISDQIQIAYIDITDTGKGIPKSQHKTIFQPGFTTKKRGWGLGLSLVKRIIENYHDGKIFVKRSEVGKGTTFRIVLKK